MTTPTATDVLVVGAGPAGSAAAAWSARAGLDTVLVDAQVFPRDKTCGDGLTPRAIGEMQRLGLEDWLRAHTVNHGLRAHGFGQTLLLPWPSLPGSSLPSWGSAVARTELDDHLRTVAIKSGALALDGARAVDVRMEGSRVAAVVFRRGEETFEIACRRLVVADGVRSPLGKLLGREWHRDTVYGVAGRAYVASEMSDDPWISSHLELRGEDGEILSGYGWIFPLGTGEVNVGVGTLATSRRPGQHRRQAADVVLRRPAARGVPALRRAARADLRAAADGRRGLPRRRRQLGADRRRRRLRQPAQRRGHRLRPGDRPVRGRGDGRRRAPRHACGRTCCASTTARRSPSPVGSPGWPPCPGSSPRSARPGMRSDWLMTLALRWMGNLVDDADRDRAARVWRWAGRRSIARDARPPFA